MRESCGDHPGSTPWDRYGERVADALEDFYAIIPAGGIGSRLWPLSRADAPKFLHDLTGSGASLLRQTWDRLAPLAGEQRIMVVTGRAHRVAVESQLPGVEDHNVVLESEPKDSTAAIGLAAAILVRREPDVVIGSFAADHVIGDARGFRRSVREAVAVARAGYITTIGITPTEPAIGFGYIHAHGDTLDIDGAPTAHAVRSFVEKPDLDTARSYVEQGTYLWNAGMFIARADVLLEEIGRNNPTLLAGINELADAWDTSARGASSTRCGPRSRRSRSTTPSPSPLPLPDAWPSSPATSTGTTSATSPRSPSCSPVAARTTSPCSVTAPGSSPTRRAAS